jgi:hypothetical protein
MEITFLSSWFLKAIEKLIIAIFFPQNILICATIYGTFK